MARRKKIDADRCPVCRSDEIESTVISVEGGKTLVDMYCQNCGAEWTDRFDLVSRTVH